MDALQRTLRLAARSLSRTPGFSVVAVLTLAVGIGATTAIFSVVNGVLLKPLPYPEADRIVHFWQINAEGNENQVSEPNFLDVKEQSRSFSSLAEMSGPVAVSVVGGDEPVRAPGTTVSKEFFDVMRVRPALGRLFVPDEQRQGAAPAVLVSHDFWQGALGGAPDVLGRTLTFEDQVHTVVGVLPPGFDFPRGTQMWTPREQGEPQIYRTGHNWTVVGRLRDGVSVEQARADVSAVARRLKQEYGDDTWMEDATVVPLHEQLVGRVRPALLVLLGAAAFLLLIASANVGNLLLARVTSRRKELAIRLALGAGRRQVIQQFLAESLVLTLTGGGLGVLLAVWGVRLLLAFEPGGLPRLGDITVSWGVWLFALAVSLGVAVALGLAAALRGTAGDLRQALSEGQRSQAGGRSSRRVRDALVVAQVALTLVLLVGAGLLGRSFLRLLSIDPGYRTGDAVVLDVNLDRPEDPQAAQQQTRFYDELLSGLRRVPGVTAVGGVSDFPLGGNYGNGTFLVLSSAAEVQDFTFEDFGRLMKDPSRTGYAEYRVASEGYFPAMGIPLVRGRLFDERDVADAPHVAVISETLARQRWPGEDPLGKVIEFGNMDGDLRPFTIVGVVGDIRERSIDAEPRGMVYGSYRQRTAIASRFNVVMATQGSPGAAIASARRLVQQLAPDVPPRFRTLEEVFATSLADRRFSLVLLGVFGAAALLLAVMGIYGVISYLVAQRTQEIGVRMAFGARAPDVLRMVMGQGLALAGMGVAIGLASAFALTRLLSGMLYGVSATDPVAYAAVTVALLSIALGASWLPARRATRVDPMIALRGE